MSKRGKIPIAEGRRLAEKYGAPVVIVFSLHDRGDTFNVMTYGQTKKLCRHAADLGRQIAEQVLKGQIAPSEEEPVDLPDTPAVWEKS
jgi:hypothetical protein